MTSTLPNHGRGDYRPGFIIVELLVVITINGMLTAILIPAVMAARAEASGGAFEGFDDAGSMFNSIG